MSAGRKRLRAPVQGPADVAEARNHRGENQMDQTQKWFAGVDWASQKHDVWLADASGKQAFEHSGQGGLPKCAIGLSPQAAASLRTFMLRSRFHMGAFFCYSFALVSQRS